MSVVIQDTLVDLGTADLKTATPLSHRNLIINGDFRINQRSATSRTQTSSEYNYDRWYWDGTYLYQGVEDVNVRNGTFTLSWTDSGSDITAHYAISTDTTASNGPDSGLTYTSVSNGGQITVNEATEYSKHLWIRFGGTPANLSKVQLEEGSVATPFEHHSYGEELALCKRYCHRIEQKNTWTIAVEGTWGSSGNFQAPIFFPVQMRVPPTFSYSGTGTWDAVYNATSIVSITGEITLGDNADGRVALLTGTANSGTTPGIGAGGGMRVQTNTAGEYMQFDAEL